MPLGLLDSSSAKLWSAQSAPAPRAPAGTALLEEALRFRLPGEPTVSASPSGVVVPKSEPDTTTVAAAEAVMLRGTDIAAADPVEAGTLASAGPQDAPAEHPPAPAPATVAAFAVQLSAPPLKTVVAPTAAAPAPAAPSRQPLRAGESRPIEAMLLPTASADIGSADISSSTGHPGEPRLAVRDADAPEGDEGSITPGDVPSADIPAPVADVTAASPVAALVPPDTRSATTFAGGSTDAPVSRSSPSVAILDAAASAGSATRTRSRVGSEAPAAASALSAPPRQGSPDLGAIGASVAPVASVEGASPGIAPPQWTSAIAAPAPPSAGLATVTSAVPSDVAIPAGTQPVSPGIARTPVRLPSGPEIRVADGTALVSPAATGFGPAKPTAASPVAEVAQSAPSVSVAAQAHAGLRKSQTTGGAPPLPTSTVPPIPVVRVAGTPAPSSGPTAVEAAAPLGQTTMPAVPEKAQAAPMTSVPSGPVNSTPSASDDPLPTAPTIAGPVPAGLAPVVTATESVEAAGAAPAPTATLLASTVAGPVSIGASRVAAAAPIAKPLVVAAGRVAPPAAERADDTAAISASPSRSTAAGTQRSRLVTESAQEASAQSEGSVTAGAAAMPSFGEHLSKLAIDSIAASSVAADTIPQTGHGLLAAPTPIAHAAGIAASAAQAHMLANPVPVASVPVEIGLRSLAGVSRFDIRLDPEDLGQIEVRLDIGEEGRLRAHIVVERPEALLSLQREAPQLERALEQAGFKTGDDGVSMSLRQQGQDGASGRREDGRESPPSSSSSRASEPERAGEPAPPRNRYALSRASGVDRHI